MKYFLIIFSLFWVVSSVAQVKVVTLEKPSKAKYRYSQVEPSICINPKNTNEVIAGSVLNDYYYSTDGGESWTSKSIKCKWGVHGDPCMLIDTAQRYYYFHLSNVKRNGGRLTGGMICQRSDVIEGKFKMKTAGRTKVVGKYDDKEWVALDPRNNNIYMTWTQFDAYDSDKPEDYSNILFSKSTDGGLSWSDPVDISAIPGDCEDGDQTAEGAVPAIGPNGEIYVCWARNDSLWFNVSTDEGKTWLSKERFVSTQSQGWVLDIPGIYRCNGLPVTSCDISNGPNRGNIYLCWADQRNGTDDTDVWLAVSSDGGKSWSKDRKVNTDESGKHQFLPWMTIDQATGYLYFVFYDRRDQTAKKTDVYLARSKDGAETFENFLISQSPFLPTKDIFFGDYTNISVHNGVIRPIWTRLHKGKISVHTALIHQDQLDQIK